MRCDAMPCDAMPCDAMLYICMLYSAMRCDAMPCDAMPCDAMPCCTSTCYILQCYEMPCDTMRCHVVHVHAIFCEDPSYPLIEQNAYCVFEIAKHVMRCKEMLWKRICVLLQAEDDSTEQLHQKLDNTTICAEVIELLVYEHNCD